MTIEERLQFEYETLQKLGEYLRAFFDKNKKYERKGIMDISQLNLIYTRMYLCYMSALQGLTVVTSLGPNSQRNMEEIVDIARNIIEYYENYQINAVISVKDPDMVKDLGFDHINLYRKETKRNDDTSIHQSTDERQDGQADS